MTSTEKQAVRRKRLQENGKRELTITVPSEHADKMKLLASYLCFGGSEMCCSSPDLTIVFTSIKGASK